MHIIYNGVAMDVITLDTFEYATVFDDSQTDVLYQRIRILCSAMVNGQASVRAVAGPPISYTSAGSAIDRVASIATNPPGASVTPPNVLTDSTRLLGAVENIAAESFPPTNASPYAGAVFGGGTGNPFSSIPVTASAWASDVRFVEILVPGPGSAVLTQQLVAKRLTDARQSLFVFSGTGSSPGQLLLQSPVNTGDYCDAKNGPKPTVYNINRAFGDGITFFVNFGIETYVRLQNKIFGNPDYDEGGGLLSNRFSMTHTINEDSFTEIDVVGTAIFDTSQFYDEGTSIDSFRPNLMLPIPQGFVRENIVVTGSEDGSTLTYSFKDVQQPMNYCFAPFIPVMRVEAHHRQAVAGEETNLIDSALSSYESYLNRKWLKKAAEEDSGKKINYMSRLTHAAHPHPHP